MVGTYQLWTEQIIRFNLTLIMCWKGNSQTCYKRGIPYLFKVPCPQIWPVLYLLALNWGCPDGPKNEKRRIWGTLLSGPKAHWLILKLKNLVQIWFGNSVVVTLKLKVLKFTYLGSKWLNKEFRFRKGECCYCYKYEVCKAVWIFQNHSPSSLPLQQTLSYHKIVGPAPSFSFLSPNPNFIPLVWFG